MVAAVPAAASSSLNANSDGAGFSRLPAVHQKRETRGFPSSFFHERSLNLFCWLGRQLVL